MCQKSAEMPGMQIEVQGVVQGVGFRPFIYRLASELGLTGHVCNTPQGVHIQVNGAPDLLENFIQRMTCELPSLAHIDSINVDKIEMSLAEGFTIISSADAGQHRALILPDVATCPDCLREIFDPSDRHFHYPFTNCTNCGPRYSIIETLPYDRPHTAMREFEMCPSCQDEYDNPLDRRFHAQPNACPDCGPQLALWDHAGQTVATTYDALLQACDALRQGLIVAVKGLGGFQLLVDARS
ncbi:MAG: acylphosphatase, partial [Anaerolineae bacterium]|nr:acylphosphatase [Anaerolineae bacterium]